MPWSPRKGLGDVLPRACGLGALPPEGLGAAFGKLKQYDPSLRQRYTDLMVDALMGMGVSAPRARHNGYGMMGSCWTGRRWKSSPPADDAKRSYNRGDYWGAALGALGAIPMAGKGATQRKP